MTPARGPRRSLVILAKTPRAGRVKTRLARDIGTVAAAWWFRHQLAALVRRLSADPRWRTVMAVSPDGARRGLPRAEATIPQGNGDLGRRIARALAAQPPGPALLVGSDIPGIRPAHVARAFALLGRHEAVIGPSPDGGFWLVGLRRGAEALPRGAFEGVRWSSEHAMADTLASLAPLRVGIADRLADVDSAADLVALSPARRSGA